MSLVAPFASRPLFKKNPWLATPGPDDLSPPNSHPGQSLPVAALFVVLASRESERRRDTDQIERPGSGVAILVLVLGSAVCALPAGVGKADRRRGCDNRQSLIIKVAQLCDSSTSYRIQVMLARSVESHRRTCSIALRTC